jgi:hypothetical protein
LQFHQELINICKLTMKREEPFVAYKVLPRTRISTGTPREKMEQLLNIALVSPFFLTLIIFIVAIAFAPGVKNEIAPATEHDHEEMDHARSSSPETVAVLAPGLGSERDDRMDEDQYEIGKKEEGSIHTAI